MASTQFQTRSDSLPTKSHPLMSELDDQICRIKTCESTSAASTSITHKMSCLQDVYDVVNKILLLPQTQPALSQLRNRKFVDDLLDESLKILDVCNAAKDALLQTKEYNFELQSSIRRRQGGSENNLQNEVKKYVTSRKMAKKAIQKALRNLRSLENKNSIKKSNNDIENFINMLRDVQQVTLTLMKSFMYFISGTKSESKIKNWSLVRKHVLQERIASEEEVDLANEFAKADSALEILIGKCDNIENVQNLLKNLEMCIQDFEDGIHNLFRRMIRVRVSLLNIFN